MKLHLKCPTASIGKISLLLFILTFAAWLFTFNAENCLSRDFVTKAAPAICWRTFNDYENTIEYSSIISLVLLASAIVCGSIMLSRLIIKRSHTTAKENKIAALLLGGMSSLLLIFIVAVLVIYARTTFNNNNYALNMAADVTTNVGIPALLALVTATAVYALKSSKRKRFTSYYLIETCDVNKYRPNAKHH